jgi:putative Holliday junction resolvase
VTTVRGCVLGIDYGSRRIGLAISDPDRVFAFPAGCLERRGGGQDLAALREIVEARGVVQIVVGLPIHMNGREGPEARAARAFAASLGRETGRSVDLFDERWTSRAAERALRDGPQGRTARSRSGRAARRSRARCPTGSSPAVSPLAAAPGEIDQAAATLLLRTWLERRARGVEGER